MEDVIGPTGEFPYGKPLINGDMGALNAQFLVNLDKNLLALSFGKRIGGFGLTHREARNMIVRIRTAIISNFGQIEYPKCVDGFPIVFRVIDTEFGPRVMLWMSKLTEVIVGSPAFWLVYCMLLETEAKKIMEN